MPFAASPSHHHFYRWYGYHLEWVMTLFYPPYQDSLYIGMGWPYVIPHDFTGSPGAENAPAIGSTGHGSSARTLPGKWSAVVVFFQWISTMGYGFVWKCWVNLPNEIAIFHRDNDQQNHWVKRGLAYFQTHPYNGRYCRLTMIFGFVWKSCIPPNSRHVGHDEPQWDMDYITTFSWCAMLLENVVEPPNNASLFIERMMRHHYLW